MRVFITGASGFIGSAIVPLLLDSGRQVLALARSDASADALAAAGAQVLRGDLTDPDLLREGAAGSDGVIHLAFNHDFSRFADSAKEERAAFEAYGEALAGTGRPLLFASGLLGLTPGRVATEEDTLGSMANPRAQALQYATELADRGVRTIQLRLAPSVHDDSLPGFLGYLVETARRTGTAGYLGDGSARWPAVHRLDVADLVLRALDRAPAGSVLHAVAEQGISQREIAEGIAAGLGLPLREVPAEQAADHFGWLAPMVAPDTRADAARTRALLDWAPSHPGLLADLREGLRRSAG
ncbi:SDR family oxidoreductase [Kitasatospora sp. NPDC006697]|uniref:SDR family oxidoreductase n=1 Tax=Kitasatospora sp. NPDC006697 TaxID=3364020 RepID=UPI0036A8A825